MQTKKRILISSGGTGGHVFPSIALAQRLKEAENDIEILFVGGGLSKNAYFNSSNHPFKDISCGSFASKNPLKLFKSIGKILQGLYQSRKIIKEFNPDVIVSFGSYYTFPTLLAARLCKVPLVLYAADAIPGRVVRLMSPYAALTAIHFPSTVHYLKGKTLEAALPLRTGYTKGAVSREKASAHYDLDPTKTTFLIFGGSQGARALNQLIPEAFFSLKNEKSQIQVVHLTGNDEPKHLQTLYRQNDIQAVVKSFENHMDIAWSTTDFVISRSGAATLAEAMAFEVPALLIPYPTAMDNHQEHNARFLEQIGGASVHIEKTLTKETLYKAIQSLLENNQAKINQMKQAIKDYKLVTQRKELAEIVLETRRKN